jgi:predicted amidohydrolase YtcJ
MRENSLIFLMRKGGIALGKLWFNGTFYTMQAEGHSVDAIYTEKGKILKLGTKEELEIWLGDQIYEVIDCAGGIVLPGFIDSHMHLIGHGESLKRVDLSKCHSYDEMISSMDDAVNQAKENEWIIGEGWDENQWQSTARFLKKDLDDLSSANPIVLKRACRHVYFVNSKVLEIAQITGKTIIEGGQIGTDKNGQLNGLLYDEAVNAVLKAMPSPDEVYLTSALETAIKDCWNHGIVGVVTEDLGYYGNALNVLKSFEKILNKMPFFANLLIHHTVFEEIVPYLSNHSKRLSFGGIKAFIDGSFGGRTALLSSPYQDDQSTNGLQVTSVQKLEEITKKAREHKVPVAFHMIGDLAVQQGIDAIQKYRNNSILPDRLIHCELLSPTLVQKMKGLFAVVDIQSSFLYNDYPWLIERVGEERNQYAFLIRTLLEEGIRLANGSDTPIESINPWLGIYTSITRKAKNGIPYNKEESISIYEALQLYTTSSAASIGLQENKGQLNEGYDADFQFISHNPFIIDEEEVINIQCLKTIIKEEIVFEKEWN